MCNLCNRYKASLERISQHAGSDIFAKIDTLLSENKRIQAISLYWGLHPEIGLLEAKIAIENYQLKLRQTDNLPDDLTNWLINR